MPFDATSRHLFIAGKLMFPAAFPKLGKIEIQRSEFKLRSDCDGGVVTVSILRFTEKYSQGWSIVREVLAANVAAVFVPGAPDQFDGSEGWECRGEWMTGDEAAIVLATGADEGREGGEPPTDAGCKPGGVSGLLFLDEHVSVWNHISYGSSAADSVDFVPCDDHRGCCNPIPCCPSKK